MKSYFFLLITILFLACKNNEHKTGTVDVVEDLGKKTHELLPDDRDSQQQEQSVPAETEIFFDNENYDFGSIPDTKPVSYYFVYKNKGEKPLVLSNVKGSCGCTIVDFNKKPLAPGKKDSILAEFNPKNQSSPFNKTITVEGNFTKKVIKFSGTIQN